MVFVDEGDSKIGPLEAPYIKLYSLPTLNGTRVSVALELLGIKYIARKVDFPAKEHKENWFLKLNIDGRIPVLTDVNEKGEIFALSESGAILVYLADKYDSENKISFPKGSNDYYTSLKWVFFHLSGLAVAQGNLQNFKNSQTPHEDVINKFQTDLERFYSTLNEQLVKNGTGFIVGDHISIADISNLPHVTKVTERVGLDLSKYPAVKSWYEKLTAIPEVAKGLTIPN